MTNVTTSSPLEPARLDRRAFLKVTAITGVGFAIGVYDHSAQAAHHGKPKADMPRAFGHFVKIANDNTVTVIIKHLDKGQGVTTGLTAIVAEELDADWAQMRWQFAPADATRYNNLHWGPYQGTGGSSSVANSWQQLRQAGAAARDMLVRAAAAKWRVDAREISVAKGIVKHSSGKQIAFGQLAEAAAAMAPPAQPTLKKPEQFQLLGTHLPRIDSAEKITGRAQYTIDVRRPGMLSAVIVHPPRFGAAATAVDDSAAKKLPGVRAVLTLPRGVAVVADNYWAASRARSALRITWDESQAEKRGSEQLWQAFRALGNQAGQVAKNAGDVAAVMKAATTTLELEFEFPYLAHATMEPMNCVVEVNKERCDVWTGSQLPSVDVHVAAQITGLPPESIFIHTQLAGGSFGRRAVPDSDFVMEATMIAKAMPGIPISLQWSREDDMKAGRYRPMTYHKFKAALDARGQVLAWHQRVVSQAILRGTGFEGMIKGPLDPTLTEGGATLPYAIPNLLVDGHEAEVGVPALWWRAVGHTHNAYGTEVFFDELAHALQQDPLQLRLSLLKHHPRHVGVLQLAADKAGWGRSLPANRAQGVALHESFNTYVAQVAEVTLNADGTYAVDRIVCAVDCGVALTPDVIKAQMEGGIGYGLGAAMAEKITLREGRVEQNNFYDYFPLRIDKMPAIEVHIIKSAEAPTGVGEPGTPPAAPAVANALRKLTGKPITRLPFGDKISV